MATKTTGTSTSTGSRDFYGKMPTWQEEQLVGNAAWEGEFRDQMSGIAGKAQSDPRDVLGLSSGEKNAVADAGKATDWASGQNKSIMSGLGGLDIASDLGNVYDPKKMGSYDKAGNWTTVKAPDSKFNYVAGPEDADFDALRNKYENQYTDDVVSTTLAGMTREEQRAQLARDAKNAAIGGTSNSRSAVADAVAGNLSGMSMAEMEAKLRSEAFNTAADYGLKEGDLTQGFNLKQSEFAKSQEDAARKWGLDLADFGLEQEKAKGTYNLGKSQQDLDYTMAQAEHELGLAGFSLEEAVAQAKQGNTAFDSMLKKYGLTADLVQGEYERQTGQAGLEGNLATVGRELSQGQVDSDYYSGMEAGSWLADVYDKTRTNDSAPYSYEETGTTTEKSSVKEKDKGGWWKDVASGAAAGLSSSFK